MKIYKLLLILAVAAIAVYVFKQHGQKMITGGKARLGLFESPNREAVAQDLEVA